MNAQVDLETRLLTLTGEPPSSGETLTGGLVFVRRGVAERLPAGALVEIGLKAWDFPTDILLSKCVPVRPEADRTPYTISLSLNTNELLAKFTAGVQFFDLAVEVKYEPVIGAGYKKTHRRRFRVNAGVLNDTDASPTQAANPDTVWVAHAHAQSLSSGQKTQARANIGAASADALATEITDRTNADALLAPKASPALTGVPTSPTAAPGTNTTQIATTAFVAAATAGVATVTSVGLSLPNIFSVSGSPVTTSGTLTATLATQTANTFFAGPTGGGAATPAFRGIVAGDVPTLNQSTTGNAATATALATPRAINGVNFNGTAPITITCAAGTLTGASLAVNVTASSLTSFGASPAFTGTPTAPTPAGGTNTTQIPTTAWVLSELTAAVAGLLDFKGTTDCSANPNYPAASKGDAYIVSVTGKIGGASGTSVDVGDWYIAQADNAGGTEASVGSSWGHMEHNLVGALLAANNLSDLANAATARTNLGIGNVENTALSTWAGTANITIVGTIGTGTWQGSIIGPTYLGTGSSITTKFLRGDGTWQTVDTTITANSTATSGLSAGDLLKSDGTKVQAFTPGAGVLAFLATPTSANLATAITDETGSGALVFATSPTLVTPVLGTPTSGNFGTGTFTWPTFNQNTTGSAATLTTPRAIYGNNFDGSAALTQIIASTFGGTGNGFTKFSGPTTAERTKTLRDATDTILELGGSYTPTGTWTNLTLVNPALGTPASGVATNLTGTAAGLTAGNATLAATVTIANEASDTTCFLVFVNSATGSLALKTNSSITADSTTGVIGAQAFEGAASGANDGGYLQFNASATAIGGQITMNAGSHSSAGGQISLTGGTQTNCAGGSIIGNGGSATGAFGGTIDVSGGVLPGGSITLTDGGGSIDTTGTGSIGLGVSGTRTTLFGTANTDRNIYFQNADGNVITTGNLTDITAVGTVTSGVWNAGAVTSSGAVTATSFAGAGSALTALNATNLGSGTVPDARNTVTNSTTTSLTGLNAATTTNLVKPIARQTFSNVAATVTAGNNLIAQIGTMSASRALTLPAANAVTAGDRIVVVDESGTLTTSNTIVITRASTDTISGRTTITLLSPYAYSVLESDGSSKWSIVGGSVMPGAISFLDTVGGSTVWTFNPYSGSSTFLLGSSLAFSGGSIYSVGGGDLTLVSSSGKLAINDRLALTAGLSCTPQALTGAGAVNLTTLTTAFTSNAAANALTLADGTNGQIKTIVHVVKGALGTGVLTPTTANGYTTITFTNAGDSVTLQYFTSGGWVVIASRGVTIT